MTYSTPVPLVGAGQGVSFAYFFFFLLGVPGSAEAPFDNPETLDGTTGMRLRPKASNSFFMSLSCVSSYFIPLGSCSNLQISAFTSCLWSNRSWTQLLIPSLSSFQHPLSPGLGSSACHTASLSHPPSPLHV